MKTLVMWLLGLSGVALAGEVPEANRPTIPPVDRRPETAIENRPLWDRPAQGATLQQQTEHAMDRGNGRLEDPTLFQLRQDQLDQAAAQGVPGAARAAYAHQQDRADQVEQMRLKASNNAMRAQRVERESETLAVERRNWEAALHRDNNAVGASVDKQALDQADVDYRSMVSEATKTRDAAFAAAGDDREKQAAAQRAFEQTKADALNAREARKASVLGNR
jgi:hypothetical protein